MKTITGAAIAAVLAAAVTSPAAAQSDILLRLRSGSPLGDRFRVDSASGFVAKGVLGVGIIPFTGAGERLMWHPNKAAFRAGSIGSAGTQWDDPNTGYYTWAGGYNTTALGLASFAMGYQSTALNSYATALGYTANADGTGAGERLQWDPYHAAFRAGSIGSAGTQWVLANTGFYTWAGGYNTTALGLASFAMGYQSTALNSYAVALGYTANADGTGAVSLGYRTTADADYSVAIGQRASTNGHAGAIVLSDGSTTDSTQASANNQFTVRAAGGVRLFSNATMTTGVQVAAGGSSWAVISDRNRKEGFLAVDGEDVLARLRFVPVTTWRYRDEADRSTLHIGPMAQDWHRAFGFTRDDRTINMSDFDGVNLAAAQALERRTAALRDEVDALRRANAALEGRTAQQREEMDELRRANAALEARLQRLEARASGSAAP